jgi:hypothetical protein
VKRPWTAGAFPGPTDAGGLMNAADIALRRLRELRIPFPENSRLERARAHVAAVQAREDDQASNEVLAEAVRTIFEMYWICRALGDSVGRPDDKRLTNSLAQMLGGPDVFRDEDELTSRPRNTQFELFVGAWLAAGGVHVVLAEPDLLMQYGDRVIGVAAKRVRSRAKLKRRVVEAANQIRKSAGSGFIVLNVDHLLAELPADRDHTALGRHFDASVPEYEESLHLMSKRPWVKSFLAIGLQVVCSRDGLFRRLDIRAFQKWRFLPLTTEEATFAVAFEREFRAKQAERFKDW